MHKDNFVFKIVPKEMDRLRKWEHFNQFIVDFAKQAYLEIRRSTGPREFTEILVALTIGAYVRGWFDSFDEKNDSDPESYRHKFRQDIEILYLEIKQRVKEALDKAKASSPRHRDDRSKGS